MKKIFLSVFLFITTLSFCQTGTYTVGKTDVYVNDKKQNTWNECGTIIIEKKEGNTVNIEISYSDYFNKFIATFDHLKKFDQYLYYSKENYLTIRFDTLRNGNVIYLESNGQKKFIFKITNYVDETLLTTKKKSSN